MIPHNVAARVVGGGNVSGGGRTVMEVKIEVDVGDEALPSAPNRDQA
jgi:hypothetical protein